MDLQADHALLRNGAVEFCIVDCAAAVQPKPNSPPFASNDVLIPITLVVQLALLLDGRSRQQLVASFVI